jgi:hypothetical protein
MLKFNPGANFEDMHECKEKIQYIELAMEEQTGTHKDQLRSSIQESLYWHDTLQKW